MEHGQKLQPIPLDMDAWHAQAMTQATQQSLTTVAPPGQGEAGTGAAGKGTQMNFQERIDDLEHRLDASQHHIDDLEQTLQE